ncbi:monooxygenase [Paracoccus suum]|uniref:Monooxygenase n=1 Tax=Paracoccus suum TaxID=2259340 RepID=A0A344PM58_9RHOB|nr:FAD-dependent oxidoreductase [Paracoccus suum]AXC50463.1 monooxygenase [Paracoccus suum]
MWTSSAQCSGRNIAPESALTGRRVTIIGAGIAGLSAALALARAGADVTVHERAGALREVGAGIQISPNAGRALDALGLSAGLDRISHPSEAVVLRESGGRQVARLNFARHRPEAIFRFVHRARLVELLESAARAAGAAIHLGSPLTEPPADAELVVGADGLHSAQRAAMNGPEVPFFTGQTAWRALIATEAEPSPVAQVFMGPGRHLVSYPLGKGLRNIVAVLETPEWTAEGWSQPGDPDDLRAAFRDFGGPVPEWLARVDACGHWGLFRHPLADRWQDGRRVLIGDAAHPTLPFLAQGACMAIEDAFRLTHYLGAARDQAAAFARFEAERRPRVARIVAAADANARNYHLNGLQRLAGHTALRLGSRFVPRMVFDRFAWVYDYDPARG